MVEVDVAIAHMELVIPPGNGELRPFVKDTESKERKKLANSLRQFVKMEKGVVTEPHKVAKYLKDCEKHKLNAGIAIASRSNEGARNRSGKAKDCQSIKVFFLDLDFNNDLDEKGVRDLLAKFPVQPSFTVESGKGIHAYWLIPTIYLKLPKQYALMQRRLRALANHFEGAADIQVSQPAAVLRLSGTLNYKYDPPLPVRFVEGTGRTYDLDDDFGDLLKDVEVEPTSSQGYKCPDEKVTVDRHTELYRFARSQKARNVPLDVALAGCHVMNEKHCEPPLGRKEAEDYLTRVWNQADAPDFDAHSKDDFIRHPFTRQIVARNQKNIWRALQKLGVKLWWDDFCNKPMIEYGSFKCTYEDEQRARLLSDIEEICKFVPPESYFDRVMKDRFWRNKRHPVRQYLESLVWDQQPRIDDWLMAYAGVSQGGPSEQNYVRAVSRIFLMAAVGRIYQPGVKFDEMVVLESKQGTGKSSLLQALCDDEDWFSDDLPLNVDAKQIIERTAGKWLIEAAELSGMHASQVEHLKTMLSRGTDGPVRMAYGHLPIEKPRHFVLMGTTNAGDYLDDPTGNRRFWPVKVTNILLPEIRRDRDQLWAEAVVRWKDPEHGGAQSIRLHESLYDAAAGEQEKRRSIDPWESILEDEWTDEYQRLIPQDVWTALGIPTDRQDRRGQKRVSAIMQRLGYKRQAVRRGDDVSSNGWGRGDEPPKLPSFVARDATEAPHDGCSW